MNETLKVIHSRRSIRAFREEQIADSELQEILGAALVAPSAVNQQPWHFTVIQNRELLDRMVKDVATAIKTSGMRISPQMLERVSSPDYHTFYHAPTVIIVSGNENSLFAQNDCANAAQNILLAAESLNIGSCWIASLLPLFTSEKGAQWKKELSIPGGYNPICSIALGYKAGESPAAPPRKQEVINYIR